MSPGLRYIIMTVADPSLIRKSSVVRKPHVELGNANESLLPEYYKHIIAEAGIMDYDTREISGE